VSARDEAALFSRYLLRTDPAPDVVERYADACDRLFPGPPSAADGALVAYARRHPRLLPSLDAAAAILRPGALLRRKILVMAAILEATPGGAEHFLPRANTRAGLAWLLISTGAAAVAHVALGVPLLWLAQRVDQAAEPAVPQGRQA